MSRDDYYGGFYSEIYEKEKESDETIIVEEDNDYLFEFKIPEEIKNELDEILEKENTTLEEALESFVITTLNSGHLPE